MRKKPNTQNQRGQSMIETALLFPILLLLFAGMIEVVFVFRSYLVILDSTYQGAHLGSQGINLYNDTEIYTLVTQDLSPGYNNSNLIDVIITRATLNGGTSITINSGYPKNMKGSGRASILTPAILMSRLRCKPSPPYPPPGECDPSGRLIAVEVVYDQPLLFDFSFTRGIIPNPVPLVAYTIQYVAR
jgi:hypothetical protein